MSAEPAAPAITGAEARRAARNAGAIAAASILSRGLQFGWQLILIPGLGPVAFGVYGAVSAFVQIGTAIPQFGMGPIVIRDIARRPQLAGRYLAVTLFLQTSLALLAYVGLSLVAALAGYDLTVRAFLAIAAVNLIVDALGNMASDLLLAHERMLATSAVTIFHVVALIALAGLGLAAGYSLFGVYLGVFLAGVLRATLLWVFLLRQRIRPAWPLDRPLARGLFINGAPLALAAFLSLAYQQLDKLLTNRLIGTVETGYLALAFIIVFGVVELLNTTVLTALYPLMSRAHGDGRGELLGFMVEKLAYFTLILCLLITLLISLFSADILVPLFGEDFRPAAAVLSLLIWYALIMMVGNMPAQGLLVQNRQRRTLVMRASGVGLNLILLLILLPRLGVIGAAVASILAESFVVAQILMTFRAPGWNPRTLIPRVIRLALAGGLTALVMLFLRPVQPVIAMLAGALVYLIALRLFAVFAPDDYDLLYRLTAALPGGAFIRRFWRRDTVINW